MGVAHGERCFRFRPACQPAHAAAQLRHAHGGKRRGPAHGADDPGPRRYFHQPDLYPCGAGQVEDGVQEVSSARQTKRAGGETMKQHESRVSTEIQKGIGKFLDSLRGERNASSHTLRAYSNELRRFAEYLGPEARWNEIDHVTIRGFLSHLHGCGLSKVSVARALAALRSMYKWLGREGIVVQNPAKLVSSPRLPKKLPRVPTMEEINGLLNTDMPESAAFPERDRAIFELLYGCGLRNSELVGVELGDIEAANGVILIRGKGKKQRYVPLEGAAAEALTGYREARQKVLKATRTNTRRLFINQRG